MTAKARSSVMSIYNPWCRDERGVRPAQHDGRHAIRVPARDWLMPASFDYEPLREGVASRAAAHRAGGARRRARPGDASGCSRSARRSRRRRSGRVHALGQRAFGENYVQEAAAKMDALADLPDIEWHLIGPLQSNKARARGGALRLGADASTGCAIAERLSAARPHGTAAARRLRAGQHQRRGDKSGVAPDEARRARARRRRAAAARVARPHGHRRADGRCRRGSARSSGVLRELLRRLRGPPGLPLDTLSMGMSADLEAAIAEGATMVRVGTAMFGPRGRA